MTVGSTFLHDFPILYYFSQRLLSLLFMSCIAHCFYSHLPTVTFAFSSCEFSPPLLSCLSPSFLHASTLPCPLALSDPPIWPSVTPSSSFNTPPCHLCSVQISAPSFMIPSCSVSIIAFFLIPPPRSSSHSFSQLSKCPRRSLGMHDIGCKTPLCCFLKFSVHLLLVSGCRESLLLSIMSQPEGWIEKAAARLEEAGERARLTHTQTKEKPERHMRFWDWHTSSEGLAS